MVGKGRGMAVPVPERDSGAGDDSAVSGRWVLLCYRMPREPSTPRIAVWRRLERLGVARLGDGLVALPADARTREQLEWVAEEIADAGGSCIVWLATAASQTQEKQIAVSMREARAAEYAAVAAAAITAAGAPSAERARVARRLRAELRRIARRDFFPPADRDVAVSAVRRLADDAAAHGMGEPTAEVRR